MHHHVPAYCIQRFQTEEVGNRQSQTEVWAVKTVCQAVDGVQQGVLAIAEHEGPRLQGLTTANTVRGAMETDTPHVGTCEQLHALKLGTLNTAGPLGSNFVAKVPLYHSAVRMTCIGRWPLQTRRKATILAETGAEIFRKADMSQLHQPDLSVKRQAIPQLVS
jgi:hypothetical protein